MTEPTLQSVYGAISALPTPRPDRVIRLLFHSRQDMLRLGKPAPAPPVGAQSAAAALLGIPAVEDPDVPPGVCRMVRADDTTEDVPLR